MLIWVSHMSDPARSTRSLAGLSLGAVAAFGAVFFAAPALAGEIKLEQVFDRCHAYAAGKRAAFEGMAPVEVDPTDGDVTYQRLETDAGLATVKLIKNSECWIYGAAFQPGHRSTTSKWDDVRARARMWTNETNRSTSNSRTENDAGVNAVICTAGAKAHQNTATGGGTDDEDRALTFSSRVFDYSKCP